MLEVDQVYHLACPASPVHYQYNAVKTIKTSVIGTINMLGLAKRVKARILQASTSEVYGDPHVHPQTEDYWGNVNPIGIRSCYDEGKRVAETLMMDYHRQNNVDIRIIRIFNTYGPRMALEDGRVISNFIVQALTGKDITIYGEGQQTRSFCYVSDLVEGLTRLMNRDDVSDPVNLGNLGEFTIIEVAKKVLELISTPSAIIHRELPPDDPGRRRLDITRAREWLDWQPTVPGEAGTPQWTSAARRAPAHRARAQDHRQRPRPELSERAGRIRARERCLRQAGFRYKRAEPRAVFTLDHIVNYATPGYATAVFVTAQGVERIRTTAESHRRIAIIEVMGRHSGYIALGSAYGRPDLVLVPEHASIWSTSSSA